MIEPYGAFRVRLDDELSPRDPGLHMLQHGYFSNAQVIGGLILLVDGRLRSSYDETRVQFVHVSVAEVMKLTGDPRLLIDRLTVAVYHSENQASDVFGEVQCVRLSPDCQQAQLLLTTGIVVTVDRDEVRAGANPSSRLPVAWKAVLRNQPDGPTHSGTTGPADATAACT